jgi:hypothetical protein
VDFFVGHAEDAAVVVLAHDEGEDAGEAGANCLHDWP